MTTTALPQNPAACELKAATAVRDGLSMRSKRLPSWLFYDEAGSDLFEQITELPEYYLTRTERAIFAEYAAEMIGQAAGDAAVGRQSGPEGKSLRLRIIELGAGSADKTRLLLQAATERQGRVIYEPIDVSASALEMARLRLEREMPAVEVVPSVADYTNGLDLEPAGPGERRLVLYIGSSIGNFEPTQALRLLEGVRAALQAGDSFLLGVDLRKDAATLLAAYDDAAGVTARFNLNILSRLNRELDADFKLDAFAHRAVWNDAESRMEMHLVSSARQRVRLGALDLTIEFRKGERIHTENSYKYALGQADELLAAAGFVPGMTWSDSRGWFAVCLARVE